MFEKRDVLGLIKPTHPRPTKKSKSRGLVFIFGLVLFGCAMIYIVAIAFYGDQRSQFLYPDGKTIESRGDFNDKGIGIGKHTDYRRDGSKRSEVNYNYFGKLDGEYLHWNSDGILISIDNYLNGLKEGESKKWNDKEELIVHEIYKNDSLVEKIK